MRKKILIGLVVLAGIISIPFVLVRLAFGPLHSSVVIDLGKEGELICDETYNGDFAGEFYDVTMTLKTVAGKTYNMGVVTFRSQDWSKTLTAKRIGDWLVVPMQPEMFVHLKALNTVTGEFNDTILEPSELRKDLLYKTKFKDGPDHLYPGSSSIIDFSGNMLEVKYEYKARAEYPPEILVSQKVSYEISPTEGNIRTKEVADRVVQ